MAREVDSLTEFRRSPRGFAVMGILVGALMHTYAFAADPSGDLDKQQTSTLEEVVVTGTLIPRPEVESPAPLTFVNHDTIAKSGVVSVGDLLSKFPQFNVGMNSAGAAFDEADSGTAELDLRGLGTNRTLVLVDGHRRVSGSANSSAVDLNAIPIAMIDHVEVVTGGTSAVYGADAVSGVVNVITRHNFEGLKVQTNAGISSHNDGLTYGLNALGGTNFAGDRGHVDLALSYSRQLPVDFEDRPFGREEFAFANPAFTGPNSGVPEYISYNDVRVLYITTYPSFYLSKSIPSLGLSGGMHYEVEGGQLVPVTYTSLIGSARELGAAQGGNVPEYLSYVLLRSPLTTYSALANIDFNLTDDIHLYNSLQYTQTQSTVYDEYYRFDSRPAYFDGTGGVSLSADNPYLPASVRNVMSAGGIASLPIDMELKDQLGRLPIDNDRQTVNVLAGLRGGLGSAWNWDVFAQYGWYEDDRMDSNLLIGTNFKNATDVIADPATGTPECASAAARTAGCVPVNLFSDQPFTQAQMAYFGHDRPVYYKNTLESAGAHIEGSPVRLPAGPVEIAAGVEWREEAMEGHDDPLSATGELFFYGLTYQPTVDVGYQVREAYGEIRAPVLANLPLAQKVELDGAIRRSDYSSVGTTTAWNAGLTWNFGYGVRLRSTVAQAVRTPNLYELYGPQTVTQPRINDPCFAANVIQGTQLAKNCAAAGVPSDLADNQSLTTVNTGANPDLHPEISHNYTVGVVWVPDIVSGLSLTADYYHFRIDGAVASLAASTVAHLCYEANSLTNVFCDQITRGGPENRLQSINVNEINVGYLEDDGVDFDVGYSFNAGRFGKFKAQVLASLLFNRKYQANAFDPTSQVVQDAGEYQYPRWTGRSSVSWAKGGFEFTVNNRYVGRARTTLQEPIYYYDTPYVASVVYTDLIGTYNWSGKLSTYVGVNNVTGRYPPNIAPGYIYAGIWSGSRYDNIGRYFHVGLTYKVR
ncbi:MAG TPA: TonB-dependent receptor [Steroidobacteraceae bacterium]|nr:TonB-dependent receptor [Steroidobacteraceae bacterium]